MLIFFQANERLLPFWYDAHCRRRSKVQNGGPPVADGVGVMRGTTHCLIPDALRRSTNLACVSINGSSEIIWAKLYEPWLKAKSSHKGKSWLLIRGAMLSLALTGLQRRGRAFYSRLIALAEMNYKQQTIIASTSNTNESIIMRQVIKKKKIKKKREKMDCAHILRTSSPKQTVDP